MDYVGELRVEVDFKFLPEETFVRANDYAAVLKAIQKSAERIEQDDLFRLVKLIPDSGKSDFDQALKELQGYLGDSFRIDYVESGSIKTLAAICGVAFAVANFILDNTAAKTLEDTWEESQYHQELKSWLQENILPRSEKAEATLIEEMKSTKLDFKITRPAQQTIRITINGDENEDDDSKQGPNPTPVMPTEAKRRAVRIRNRSITQQGG